MTEDAGDVVSAAMAEAEAALREQVGTTVDILSVMPSGPDDANVLSRMVSKLSPFIGNIMEDRIVRQMSETSTSPELVWRRQDPYFPDAALYNTLSEYQGAGFEIKAWYALSTELTGRFRESVKLLRDKNIQLVVVAWMMDKVVFGSPQIIGMLSVDAESVARRRDAHYSNPPEYLVIEPEDTSDRTANLQQSNVNGFRLQGESSTQAKQLLAGSALADGCAAPHLAEAQDIISQLQQIDTYRLDTNFAKIDRINHAKIERFKRNVLATELRGRKVSDWRNLLKSLESKSSAKRADALAALSALYHQ